VKCRQRSVARQLNANEESSYLQQRRRDAGFDCDAGIISSEAKKTKAGDYCQHSNSWGQYRWFLSTAVPEAKINVTHYIGLAHIDFRFWPI
jgi:hypothetical protein